MKYQKPIVNDLSKLTFAEGSCASGLLVGDCTPNGVTAGSCISQGTTAGTCGPSGISVDPSACATNGILGVGAPTCNPHGQIASTG